MTTQAAQLQFAAEFTLFLAAVAAVSVTALRPKLCYSQAIPRLCAVVGALCLAVAAFLHGSLIVDVAHDSLLVSLRVVGIAALALSLIRWNGSSAARSLTGLSLVLLAVAEVIGRSDVSWSDGIRGVGAVALILAVLVASRRSIVTRVAAVAAAIVLLVVAVLAVALSAVIADNVEAEVERRYAARADTEAAAFLATSRIAQNDADLLARSLRQWTSEIQVASSDSPDAAAAQAQVGQVLSVYRDDVSRAQNAGPLVVAGANGRAVAAVDANEIVRVELLGSAAVQYVLTNRQPTGDVAVIGEQVFAIGAAPITSGAGGDFFGVALVTSRIDGEYLAPKVTDSASVDQQVAISIADRQRVYGEAGETVDLATELSLANRVLDSGERQTALAGDRFVVSVPVVNDAGTPFMVVNVSVPQKRIDATRADLFRLLFIVSLGAGLGAVVLAGYAGNRIGSTIEGLTAAARRLQDGDLTARAEVGQEDELGTLASTFNTMSMAIGSMTDDLRSAAAAETELRARLEGVVAGMGEALVAVDEAGTITDFNAAAEELTGHPARDALGKTLDGLCRVTSEDDVDITGRFVRPVLEAWTLPADLHSADGRSVPVAVSAGPLRGASGALQGAVFVMRDVRREREIDQMKTDFIANVSHELRTPLTPVKGYSDILASRDLSAEQVRQFASEIATGARQLERVTDQLVQFATLAAGRLHLQAEPVRAREMLDHLVQRWEGRVPPTIAVTRRVSRGTPRAVVDRRYIDVALDELVDNAVKYSPDGGRIRVSSSGGDSDGKRVLVLSVQDQGVGIDPDRVETIFDDFAQVDGSATRRFGGLGLGLALVSRIVRAHGGDLECESTLGRGTTIRIVLPVEPPEEAT